MSAVTVMVAVENRYRRGADGRVCSTTGVDGYRFWRRYLETFDRVLILARTRRSEDPEGGEPVEGPGVEVVPLPDYCGPVGFVRVRRALERAVTAAVERADVLCLRAPGPIAGSAWRARGRRPYGVEVIGDPLDALSRGAVRSIGRPLARLVLAREQRAMCRGAVAVSYVTEEALQRRYPPGGWSTACSDAGLGDDAFVDEGLVRARAACRAIAERRLVFVGSLAQLYKGQEVLLDAVARCRARGLDVSLTVVGDGRYRGRLEARARPLGPAVTFAGQLPAGAAVRDEVDRADLFVLPSRAEGLPRAMLEAMARGVPCVGSRVGGVPELLPAERLVPPGDATALADVVARLCAPTADLVTPGLRDLAVARRYHEHRLEPRRLAFHARLAAAAADGCAPVRASPPAAPSPARLAG
jgi:glycosyltransferase involved in cell wall biosynthesis